MKYHFFLLFSCMAVLGSAQTDTTEASVTFSGYLEPYYGYDFGNPAGGNRPGFVYSHSRHNEFNLNIGLIKASASAGRFRGNLALMNGTYASANLSAEPEVWRHIYEANAGFGNKTKNGGEWWLDLGIFGSHIGFESAIGKDCWTLSRSILADNSPYYESGAKFGYTPAGGKWFFSALILNGWQRILRETNDKALSGGWQIQYKPSGKVTLNSSSYFGPSGGEGQDNLRLFHNFYGIFQLNSQVGLTVGFDSGYEKHRDGDEDGHLWYSPVAIVRYAMNDAWAIAARAEYYSDEDGVIMGTDFRTLGVSVNLDWQIHKNAVWRIEGKLFNSQNDIFTDSDGNPVGSNAVVTTVLGCSF